MKKKPIVANIRKPLIGAEASVTLGLFRPLQQSRLSGEVGDKGATNWGHWKNEMLHNEGIAKQQRARGKATA